MKENSIAKMTAELVKDIPVGAEFYTTSLWNSIALRRKTKGIPFPDTILRTIRRLRQKGDIICICVNKQQSKYKRIH